MNSKQNKTDKENKTMTHTPTKPLKYYEQILPIELLTLAENKEARMNIIIRAVNSHDELVESLKAVLILAKSITDLPPTPVIAWAEKAIAKAEGK